MGMIGDQYRGVSEHTAKEFVYIPKEIRAGTLAELHKEILYDLIWNRRASTGTTEDGEAVIEVGPRMYVAQNIIDNRFWEVLPYSFRFLEEYSSAFLNGYADGVNFEYDYHSRLFHYDNPYDHNMGGIDQIKIMCDKLIKNINTRRAVAITWMPEVDNAVKDVPCLQYIQPFVRKNSLYMTVLMRSNDMLMGVGANMYAFTKLQMYMCDYISRSINKKLNIGDYTHIVVQPHLYYKRDAAEFNKVLEYFHSIGSI